MLNVVTIQTDGRNKLYACTLRESRYFASPATVGGHFSRSIRSFSKDYVSDPKSRVGYMSCGKFNFFCFMFPEHTCRLFSGAHIFTSLSPLCFE